jgi:acetyl-CoA carboxylase biotin carboxylase subunit
MLGKLVVWGSDRDEAIARSRDALDELVVDGLVTNLPLHRALLEHETFLNGQFTTNLLDRVGSAAFLNAAAAA